MNFITSGRFRMKDPSDSTPRTDTSTGTSPSPPRPLLPWQELLRLWTTAAPPEECCTLITRWLYDQLAAARVQVYRVVAGSRLVLLSSAGQALAAPACVRLDGHEIDFAAGEVRKIAGASRAPGEEKAYTTSRATVFAVRAAERLRGVLVVYPREESRQGEETDPQAEEVVHMGLMALATTLDLVALREETCARAAQMNRLLEMGEALASTLRTEELFWKIYELVGQVMDNDAFYIAFYEQGARVFDMVFVIDEGQRFARKVEPLGAGIASEALRRTRAVRYNRTPRDMRTAGRDLSMRFGNRDRVSRSLLAAPIISRGRVIGVISTQSYRANAYSEEDADFLSIIASQAGVAIENARLFETQERYARRLRLINEISRRVSDVLDEEVLLRRFVRTLRRRLGYRQVDLVMRDGSAWRPVKPESRVGVFGSAVELDPVAKAAASRRRSVVRRGRARGRSRGGSEIVAELAVPLRAGSTVLGILQIEGDRARSFSREEISTLEALGQRFVGLVEKARLHKRIKMERDKLHTVLDHLEEGVGIVDTEFEWRYTNRWLKDRVGSGRRRKCYQALFGFAQPCGGCPIARSGVNFKTMTLEVCHGKGPIFALTLIPFTDENGERRVLELCRDITEKKRGEEEKLRVEKMKTALHLAGSVAHELNQPLTGITGYCSLIAEEVSSEESWFPAFKAIAEQAARIEALIKKFQKLTHLEHQAYWGASEILDLEKSVDKSS